MKTIIKNKKQLLKKCFKVIKHHQCYVKNMMMFVSICLTLFTVRAQTTKPSLTVLNVDVSGNIALTPAEAGNILRLEAEKLGNFEVTDRYDVFYLIDKNQIKINNCYGKTCLTEVGLKIHSDKMLTGTIELINETIIVTIRLIDVKAGKIEKSNVREFLKLPSEIQNMIAITLKEMFGMESNLELVNNLTKKNNYENAINNPNKTRLSLDGPRMGCVLITGEHAKILKSPEANGGFDAFPLMFQFGYQFEKQYLNEGRVQALFEFIPMLTGLEQGIFLPSFTLMHGVRDNKTGLEFAFGPTIALTTKASGYFDENNQWQLTSHWKDTVPNPYPIVRRIDKRGSADVNTGFVIAAGFTIKSGKLNMPFNLYTAMSKGGIRYGFSFGFNVRKDEQSEKRKVKMDYIW